MNSLEEECIICLQNNNEIIKYSGVCQCNPFVHKECLDEWYKIYPNMCPICRNQSRNQNIQNNIIIIHNQRCARILLGICCLMSCSCLIVPLIFIIILMNNK